MSLSQQPADHKGDHEGDERRDDFETADNSRGLLSHHFGYNGTSNMTVEQV